MILVTGAGGKTGQAVIYKLARGNEPVRAWARQPAQAAELRALGAAEIVLGDLRDPAAARAAFAGVRAVYYICPNMCPDELAITEIALSAATQAGCAHFVYHSVLHPQVQAMPHHWQKLRVEERLFTAGLPFTILQPGPYMQNVRAYWNTITQQGVYAVPYATETRLSMVDLDDVAEAAARVLSEPGHTGAIYELAGPEALSQSEMAGILAQALGRPVSAQALDRAEWEQTMRRTSMSPYALETLRRMFEYYEHSGLVGSPRVLAWLLGRPPCRFSEFVNRLIQGD